MKHLFKNFIFALISWILFFCFAEAFLGLISLKKKTVTREWLAKRKSNQLGYRDIEYSRKKKEGIFRIGIFGDSFTFGHGIDNIKDTYHKILERRLNDGFKEKKFEVMSLVKYDGGSTDTQLYDLFRDGLSLQLDLVLVGYTQDDLPLGEQFRDKSKLLYDLPSFLEESRLAKSFKFRIDRLLEKLGYKNTFPEHMNYLYNTRAWEIEKIYLDTFLNISKLKDFHFLLTIFPVMHKFGIDHPYNYNQKFDEYCESKEMDCLNYYEEGLKGHDSSKIVVDPQDRHPNERGSEIIAEILYKKLKPLKDYKHISKFHNAFTLKELIKEKNYIKKVDQVFTQLNEDKLEAKIKFDGKNVVIKKNGHQYEIGKTVDELSFQKNGNKLFLQKSYFNLLDRNPKLLSTTILDSQGRISKIEKTFFDLATNEKINWEILENISPFSVLTTGRVKKTADGISRKEEIKRSYFFYLKKGEKTESPHLEGEIYFADPKVIETNLFGSNSIYRKTLDQTQLNLLAKLSLKTISQNKKIFKDLVAQGFTDLRELNQLSPHDLTQIYWEITLFYQFMTLTRYHGLEYVNALSEEILKQKPFTFAVKTVKRYYIATNQHKKLRNI
jgi:hypothetical protein